MAEDDPRTRAAELNEQLRPIEISAETVTRPAGAHTATVHAFLRHLRDQGLDCVPEPFSLDGETETLRFIAGDSGGEAWAHQHDERGLRSAARLLRRVHNASATWTPPRDAVFAAPPVDGGQVFVHGDPGPWNFVWRDGEAVALIDWDFLHPAPPMSDVAYALQWFAPLRDDEAAVDWHHFPAVPDRRARVRAFLDAYGMPAEVDVADAVIARVRYTGDHVRFLADQGHEPQKTWVAAGLVEQTELADVEWIDAHRSLFTG
ncbi:phosphotransferase [Nocardioides bruguierae]|uniref:Aminoglycoside phosphotransferase family protein n=1 Tax=Nocardioides bruguierae TaxID=2945102 RepID=A0A9X2DBF8_9ACTN|nr:aminoglycoside phosphotransferase family protein [Nocardioides bruguierae]MCM0622798.1 aminoglycoside phosphotransferase family protein [Nocardioides bruguierae]